LHSFSLTIDTDPIQEAASGKIYAVVPPIQDSDGLAIMGQREAFSCSVFAQAVAIQADRSANPPPIFQTFSDQHEHGQFW